MALLADNAEVIFIPQLLSAQHENKGQEEITEAILHGLTQKPQARFICTAYIPNNNQHFVAVVIDLEEKKIFFDNSSLNSGISMIDLEQDGVFTKFVSDHEEKFIFAEDYQSTQSHKTGDSIQNRWKIFPAASPFANIINSLELIRNQTFTAYIPSSVQEDGEVFVVLKQPDGKMQLGRIEQSASRIMQQNDYNCGSCTIANILKRVGGLEIVAEAFGGETQFLETLKDKKQGEGVSAFFTALAIVYQQSLSALKKPLSRVVTYVAPSTPVRNI
jgi:hypothetical protein